MLSNIQIEGEVKRVVDGLVKDIVLDSVTDGLRSVAKP